MLSAGYILAEFDVRNEMFDMTESKRLWLKVQGRTTTFEVPIATDKCGEVSVKCKNIQVYDIFNVQTDAHAINSLTVLMTLASVEILWVLISGYHILLANLLFLFWMLVQLVGGVINPLGCGFFFAGLGGLWITEKNLHLY